MLSFKMQHLSDLLYAQMQKKVFLMITEFGFHIPTFFIKTHSDKILNCVTLVLS